VPRTGGWVLGDGHQTLPMRQAVPRPSSGFPASSVVRMAFPANLTRHLRGQPFFFPRPNSALVSPSPFPPRTLYIPTTASQNLCDI